MTFKIFPKFIQKLFDWYIYLKKIIEIVTTNFHFFSSIFFVLILYSQLQNFFISIFLIFNTLFKIWKKKILRFYNNFFKKNCPHQDTIFFFHFFQQKNGSFSMFKNLFLIVPAFLLDQFWLIFFQNMFLLACRYSCHQTSHSWSKKPKFLHSFTFLKITRKRKKLQMVPNGPHIGKHQKHIFTDYMLTLWANRIYYLKECRYLLNTLCKRITRKRS